MNKEYFILYEGKKKGPFAVNELEDLNISRTTLVCTADNPNWIEAEKLEDLIHIFETTTQTPPVMESPTPPVMEISNRNSLSDFGGIEYFNDGTLKLFSPETHEIITYRYANFGERFLARLLDGIIIILPSICFPLIAAFLYITLQHCSISQQTIGQKVLNIKLLSTDGSKITFGQAAGRFFSDILNYMTFFIGYLIFFTTDKKQCLHDLMASTIVVSEIRREKYRR